MGKKGLSLEQKRQKILELYYEKKEVFNLKEIEKYGAKKGVVLQSIKDVNQSLVDDSLVESDRIGAGAFFWALPSQGYQSRQNLINNVSTHIEQVKQEISVIQDKIDHEKSLRKSSGGDREDMLKQLAEARKENQELTKQVQLFEKCDPKRLDEIQKNKKVCLDGANRWTDNLYQVESWMKGMNSSITNEDLHQNFPILRDLDYMQ